MSVCPTIKYYIFTIVVFNMDKIFVRANLRVRPFQIKIVCFKKKIALFGKILHVLEKYCIKLINIAHFRKNIACFEKILHKINIYLMF